MGYGAPTALVTRYHSNAFVERRNVLEGHSMSTDRLVKAMAIGIVFFLIVLVLCYFLPTRVRMSQQSKTDVKAVSLVVEEFGDVMKEIYTTAANHDVMTEVDFNIRQLITDRLYQVFARDTSRIPGRDEPFPNPWPVRVDIDSTRLLENGAYEVQGRQIMMDDDAAAHAGDAGQIPITLTLKNVNGIWLIDDVVEGTQPKA
jgi:uncharacterized protein with GYD domain